MFAERTLAPDVEAVRSDHAPDALVLDCESDFETLPPTAREELVFLTASITPVTYPDEWLPEDVPELLRRYASADLLVGMPGDGSVAWTRQTDPPLVIVKARVTGSPESFVSFLVAEALVEVGLGNPEHFLGFFDGRYRDLAAALPFDDNRVYQVANALYDGYLGLHTREIFRSWAGTHPDLHDAWADAGERIAPRVERATKAVSSGQTGFEDAAEIACSAIKHDLDLPAPFSALDTLAYREHGADYAVKWAEKVFAES